MKKICYVIMPFTKTIETHKEKYWTNHFEKFLKPIIEENPLLEAKRSAPLRGDIIREIINNLYMAPIVIAELTDFNPNVYWELGVRQSFKHGTITIAEKDTIIPFDISTKSVLYYSKNKFKDEKFKKLLTVAIKDCLSNPKNPDSIVLESIGGRGTLFQIFLRDETIRRLDGLIKDCEWNEYIFNKSLKRAIENKRKKFKIKSYGTAPLGRLTGIELLLTNRYVDASNDFYESANTYWFLINGFNKKLENWMDAPSVVVNEIIEFVPKGKNINKDFKNRVEKIRKDLAMD